MGTPWLRSSDAMKFFACRLRTVTMAFAARGAFDTVVAAIVAVVAVAVVFEVRKVVLALVAHQMR